MKLPLEVLLKLRAVAKTFMFEVLFHELLVGNTNIA